MGTRRRHRALDELGTDPVFHAISAPSLVLDPDLRIRAANLAYQRATLRTAEDLLGKYLFDALPGNPTADGVADLAASLESVLRDGRRHHMGVQRYDIPEPGDTSRTRFVRKVWAPHNSPILDPDGDVIGVVHHAEDITDLEDLLDGSATGGDDPWELRKVISALAGLRQAHRAVLAENQNLREAMHHRSVIEQAKGVLMGQRHCGADEAFRILVELSQATNTKLNKVAQALLDDTVGRRPQADR